MNRGGGAEHGLWDTRSSTSSSHTRISLQSSGRDEESEEGAYMQEQEWERAAAFHPARLLFQVLLTLPTVPEA